MTLLNQAQLDRVASTIEKVEKQTDQFRKELQKETETANSEAKLKLQDANECLTEEVGKIESDRSLDPEAKAIRIEM